MSEKEPRKDPEPRSFNVISRWEFEIEGTHYDIRKVVELAQDLPIEEVAIAKLDSMKEGEYWYDTNRKRIKLREIFDLYEQTEGDWAAMTQLKPEYAKHIAQIEASDYENDPITLLGSSEDFRLIDGLHRLTKAWLVGEETINAHRFDDMPYEAVVAEKN